MIVGFTRKILNILGFDVIKLRDTAPLQLPEATLLKPVSLSYLIERNRVLIDVDLKRGRGLPLNSYDNTSSTYHPFSLAVSQAIKLADCEQYDKVLEVLSAYYRSVVPVNAGQFANVSKSSILNQFPAWSIVMPWDKSGVKAWEEHIKKSVVFENSLERSKKGIEGGWSWVGPVSEDKLKIEATRLTRLLQSVQEKGYRRHDYHDGDISADILINEKNEWVWQSVGGQHRASVLSGLGFNKAPVRVRKIIRRCDASSWPNVINGTFEVGEAQSFFDMVFESSFHHISSNWCEYVEKQR